jgi:Mn-dependent DtxR family transcriptional regulator
LHRSASESTEDHLERIAGLIEDKGYARVTDVAEALGVKPSTVSNMVRRLAARGFVNYEKYRGFSLTPEGRTVAAHIRARHQILTELFSLLELAPETVDQEVEDIEHHLRPQTLEIFRQLVDYWKSRPDELHDFLLFARKKNRPGCEKAVRPVRPLNSESATSGKAGGLR